MPNSADSARFSGRVQQLLAGRRAGTISMKEFKAELENLSTEELAQLASAVLEESPIAPRGDIKEDILVHFSHASKTA